jgi:hypothetical protein
MEKITAEYLKNKKLDFRPRVKAEAEFIQRELFKLGAGWKKVYGFFNEKKREVMYADYCVSGGLQVHSGTVYCNSGEKGHISCNSNQLGDGWTFDPDFRLTTEIIEKYDLVFHPKNDSAAAYLMQKLREGLVLSFQTDEAGILEHGALLSGRRLLAANAASDTGYTRLNCRMHHFRDYFGTSTQPVALLPCPAAPQVPASTPIFAASDNQRFMSALFNDLCEKMDAQTQAIAAQRKTIDALKYKVESIDKTLNPHPSKLDKRSLSS